MENQSSTFFKNALNSGIILGIILIILQLVYWMFDFIPVGLSKGILMFVVNLLIAVIAVYYFTKSYRDGELGGYISYGRAFIFGWTVYLICTLMMIIYNYIFNEFIDPGYTTKVIHESAAWTEEFMRNKGIPESQISDAVDKILEKGKPTIVKTIIQSLIGGILFGAFVSLISSAFAKRTDETLRVD
jgi:hypothetical protein